MEFLEPGLNNYWYHVKMIEEYVNSLINNLSDCSWFEINSIIVWLRDALLLIPDLQELISDVKWWNPSFLNYGFNKEPLVAEWDNWLVHIAKVDDLNYVIYPDWTHSKWIRGSINRIYVNKEWKLAVNINWIEVIVKK